MSMCRKRALTTAEAYERFDRTGRTSDGVDLRNTEYAKQLPEPAYQVYAILMDYGGCNTDKYPARNWMLDDLLWTPAQVAKFKHRFAGIWARSDVLLRRKANV